MLRPYWQRGEEAELTRVAGGQTHSDLRRPNGLGEVVGAGGSVVVMSVSDVLHSGAVGGYQKPISHPKTCMNATRRRSMRSLLAADV